MQSGGSGVASGAQAVTLRRWRVVEVVVENGARTRHLLGHDVENDDGHVSSAIVDFKREAMTATTASGARYRLAGLPGVSRKAQTVWEEWCRVHGVVSQSDVTNEYLDPNDVSTRQFVALNVSALSTKTE